jgi:quinol monooxygenase YgiN
VVTVMAKLKVQPGKESAFEGAAGELIAYVKENEPGTLTYVLHRSTADPTEYVYYEVYTDQAALAAHGGSAAMQKFFGAIGPLYDEVAAKR